MLPHFLDYYSFVDQMTFIDSGSNDRSIELIEQFSGSWDGNVRICQTGITWWDHDELHKYRDNIWRGSKMDLVLFPDCDEIFYHPLGLRKFLEKTKNDLYHLQGFEMVSETFPSSILDVKIGYPFFTYNKAMVFNPTIDIHFPNAHLVCSPTVNVNLGEIKLLHYRYMGSVHMRFRRDREASRLPKNCRYRHIDTDDEIDNILKNAITKSYKVI